MVSKKEIDYWISTLLLFSLCSVGVYYVSYYIFNYVFNDSTVNFYKIELIIQIMYAIYYWGTITKPQK